MEEVWWTCPTCSNTNRYTANQVRNRKRCVRCADKHKKLVQAWFRSEDRRAARLAGRKCACGRMFVPNDNGRPAKRCATCRKLRT